MKTTLLLIPGLFIGSVISAAVFAEDERDLTRHATPPAEIQEADAMAEDRQAESRGEVRTNAYWDEEEDRLADDVVEVKASYDPEDDASPAELQADEDGMPGQRRYREVITVEELRPDD